MIQITRYSKSGGPLTKRISLGPDGKIISDGSACLMQSGLAYRVRLTGVEELAALIGRLSANEAISLGALRGDLPDQVEITTRRRLEELNGTAVPHLIARTAEFISYRTGEPALALIDIDTKGMPADVSAHLEALGGHRNALTSIVPGLTRAAAVYRQSTSAGLYRTDTAERFPGSGGAHNYVVVQDGADIERFLKVLHDFCWLEGLGWWVVGAGGQLLERSLVDRTVYAPERLVFEGGPIVATPLAQDLAAREPHIFPGETVDTRLACPDLTLAQKARVRDVKEAAKHKLAPQAASARSAFIALQVRSLEWFGVPVTKARRMVEQQCSGVLLPNIGLPFDAAELWGKTVGDVLADPDRFVGATLADPLEGVEYGRDKAKIMRRVDGSLWIHSFAHGRTFYELKHDAESIKSAILAADQKQAPALLAGLLLDAEIEPDEEQLLRVLTCERSGLKARPLGAMIKAAMKRRAEQRAQAERQRQAAQRQDGRVCLPAPLPDDERLPVLRTLDEVLIGTTDAEPPMRDLDGRPVEVRTRQPMLFHELTEAGVNAEEAEETRLPPPEFPLLTRHDAFSMAHPIERYVEFAETDRNGAERSVALSSTFVQHFMNYRDSALPRVNSIVTTPLVLPNGSLLATPGLDRGRRLVFRIEPAVLALLPATDACTPAAVARAMDFLVNEWLVDVAADFVGKTVLIAGALTIIERVLLPERPCFFVTAGQRGGGKTTAVVMIILAVTGKKPPAAAWSPNEEERRKALLAYFMEGLAAMVWDNIPRCTAISCPSIEKSLTSDTYSDRLLGASEIQTASSSTIQWFTGNNITPRSDLTSRSLDTHLQVERADPENRPFRHSDPIAWTIKHRGRILQALYTILLGNPQLRPGTGQMPKTRFKTWWTLVGSAIENAASLMADLEKDMPNHRRRAAAIDFATIFHDFEAEDEQTNAIAGALQIMNARWGNEASFSATDVCNFILAPAQDVENAIALRGFIEQATQWRRSARRAGR